MSPIGYLWLSLATFLPPLQESDVLFRRAQQVAEYLEKAGKLPEEIFAPIVLERVGIGQLRAVFASLNGQLGKVTFVGEVERMSDFSARFRFECSKGFYTIVTLSVENRPPHRINGIFFGPPAPSAHSFSELREQFERLSGKVSVLLRRLEPNPTDLLALHPDEPLAIGSTFKLYVLGAIVEQGMRWDRVLTLKKEWKSLPSGVLHTWPDGAPITVHTLATQMISISDNTATDHLLHVLGRDTVEEVLDKMGHSRPERTVPFLSTREMFVLKSDAIVRKRYLEADDQEKRRLLEQDVAKHEVNVYEVPSQPVAIDTVEWFASTRDLCNAMDYFRQSRSEEARAILAVNPGIKTLGKAFSYIGYKGGSEAGVLNLTWLVKTSDGTWYALSATWNNTEAGLDQTKFVGYAQAVLGLLAEQHAAAAQKD